MKIKKVSPVSLIFLLSAFLVSFTTMRYVFAEPFFTGSPFNSLLAVEDDLENSPGTDATGLFDPEMLKWYKAGATVMGFLLTYWVAWFFAYPWTLRRGTVWPVTLFGNCTAIACLVSWGIVFAVYWSDMDLAPHAPWWREWGLRLTCLVFQLGTALFSWLHWRSKVDSQAS